jgi:hypothetical protein
VALPDVVSHGFSASILFSALLITAVSASWCSFWRSSRCFRNSSAISSRLRSTDYIWHLSLWQESSCWGKANTRALRAINIFSAGLCWALRSAIAFLAQIAGYGEFSNCPFAALGTVFIGIVAILLFRIGSLGSDCAGDL